jgi:arylsulfatase A-like enzyme
VARGISYFPFLDEMVLELGLRAVDAEELGRDDVPDLLCLGFSVLDRVSHEAGPWSQEAMDILLRLDRSLDELLRHLDREVGERRYVVAVSSDHGFSPLVSHSRARGERREVVGDRASQFRDQVAAALSRELDLVDPFLTTTSTWYYLDRDALGVAGVSDRQVLEVIRREARSADWIQRVFARDELLGPGDPTDDLWRRFHHHVHPSRSPDVFLVPAPWIILQRGESGSTHGSPHDHDTHVPFLVLAPEVTQGPIGGFVRTVDVAPTVADFLGVTVPEEVDGRSLRPLLVR